MLVTRRMKDNVRSELRKEDTGYARRQLHRPTRKGNLGIFPVPIKVQPEERIVPFRFDPDRTVEPECNQLFDGRAPTRSSQPPPYNYDFPGNLLRTDSMSI